MTSSNPTIWLAFLSGLLSFVSPCVLPLYPSYISYISGVSFYPGQEKQSFQVRRKAVAHAMFFILGLSVIFLALGMSANILGHVFIQYRNSISRIGGILVILMGLFLMGIFRLDFLMKEKKWSIQSKQASYLGAFLIGMSFAAGWTPCIGPILASVLVLAATQPINGFILMGFYILGFAIPFLVLAYTLGSIKWLVKYTGIISKIGGFLMVILGVLLLTNTMTVLTTWIVSKFGGFTGF